MHFQIKSIVFTTIFLLASATIPPPKKGERTKTVKELKVNAGPVDKNVFDRNLVEDEPFAKDIIVESGTYYKDTSNRLFAGPTLGFVTPVSFIISINIYSKLNFLFYFQWNGHGYNVSRIFGAKFDMLSPVWLQIVLKAKNQYEIAGTHDIQKNRKWMKEVRSAGSKKIKSKK